MRYGILTIDTKSSNKGNHIIVESIKQTLCLPKESVSVSMFCIPTKEQLDNLNSCDFVLLPGSTILAEGKNNSDAMSILDKITVPKFCVAASGWYPYMKYKTAIFKHITEPVGVRDPHTKREFDKLGIQSILVGCPTMYVKKQNIVAQSPFTIVGFARKNISFQLNLFKALSGRLIGSVQEATFELPLIKQLGIDYFSYENFDIAYKYYSKADKVVSGRLHGVLPAISQDKPIIFFGDTKDSRFSLLTYMGIPINENGNPFELKYIESFVYSNARDELNYNYLIWANQTIYGS